MDGIVPAFGNAVLIASTGDRAWQGGNLFDDFEALDAAHFDATAATYTFICGYYRNPFRFHWSDRPWELTPLILPKSLTSR